MEAIEKIYLEELKGMVAAGNTKEVLGKLGELTKEISDDVNNTLILTSGRYARANKNMSRGIISSEQLNIEYNKIDMAILYLIDEIPEEQKIQAISRVINTKNNELTVPALSDLEKVFGKEELFEANWFEKAINASRSVCKVLDSSGASGTGFMVKGGYMITNYHVFSGRVVEENELARGIGDSKIIFNYQVDADGNSQPTEEYRLDASDFLASPMQEFDYVMVKVIDNSNTLGDWGFLELDDFSEPKKGDKVNIIQHPEGTTKKFALPDNVVESENQHLFYVADTKPGSSGSPVFNQDWKVVALHHAGRNRDSKRFPFYKIKGQEVEANRGIIIKDILKDIESKGKLSQIS